MFIALFNGILLEIDRGYCALLILLDLSEAFVTDNNEELIKYLHDLVGIHGATLNWFCCFLAGMSSREMKSEGFLFPLELSCEVLQHSTLPPLVHCVYNITE